MLPTASGYLNSSIEFAEPPTRTFYLNRDNHVVAGLTDGRAAMEQAVYLILATERYRWPIFSWNYGAELGGLFGMPVSWVIPEAKRRIQEAILQDSRVLSVDDFSFETGRGALSVRFTAHTIFGDLSVEKEVPV